MNNTTLMDELTQAQSALDALDSTLPGLLAAMQAAQATVDAQRDLVASVVARRKALLASPPQDPVDDLCAAVNLEFLDGEIEYARQVHAQLDADLAAVELRLSRTRDRCRVLESDVMAAVCALRVEQRSVREESQKT